MTKCHGSYFDFGKNTRGVPQRDYAQWQSPLHFRCQFFDWNSDIACQIEDVVPELGNLFGFTAFNAEKVEVRYMNEYSGIMGCVGLTGNSSRGYNNPVINLSSAIRTTAISLDTNLGFDLSSRTLNNFKAGLRFNTASLVVSLTLSDMFDTLKASISQSLNHLTKTTIAAQVKHSFSMNQTNITFGAQHALFPLTLLKACISTSGRAGALIQQEFWQSFFVSVAGEVDLRAENKLPKIGVSVALAPRLTHEGYLST